MTYINGSLTDPNPGPALHTLMAPALTTAGFTLVDTVTISTRTHKVWKSPAAGNAANLDWYLDVSYTTTGAGNIWLGVFEVFDPATDLGYRGAYTAAITTIDAATSSRYGGTGFALETNWYSAPTSVTTTAFGYWISINADRVILLCSTAPSTAVYAGLYTPDPVYTAKAGAALFPLYAAVLTGATGSGALTRIPPWTVFPGAGNWTHVGGAFAPILPPYYPALPTGVTTGAPATAIPIILGTNSTSFPAGRWGWAKDIYAVYTSGVVRGDTCTIGGVSHVLSTTSSNVSLAFKAV